MDGGKKVRKECGGLQGVQGYGDPPTFEPGERNPKDSVCGGACPKPDAGCAHAARPMTVRETPTSLSQTELQ
jgi:hypothetical protein